MSKYCKFITFNILFLLLLLPVLGNAEEKNNLSRAPKKSEQVDTEKVFSTIDAGLKKEQISQKKNQQWQDEATLLENEIRKYKAQNAWYAFQNKKYTAYNQKLRDDIEEQKTIIQNLAVLQTKLEPFIFTVTKNLKNFVTTDLPFHTTERNFRIETLEKTIANHKLIPSEKLRRFFDALQIELDYARTADYNEAVVILDGKQTQATIVRAGRLGLYAITKDKKKAGTFAGNNTFTSIDSDAKKQLIELLSMIENKQYYLIPFIPTNNALTKEKGI